MDGELSTQNNRAIVVTEGVRDRLRVLLISGEPHPGERTWRNLLKAGAEIWFGTLGCGAFVDDGRVIGAVVATPQGRGVVLAETVIDAVRAAV